MNSQVELSEEQRSIVDAPDGALYVFILFSVVPFFFLICSIR
jgi:hypothetical protein